MQSSTGQGFFLSVFMVRLARLRFRFRLGIRCLGPSLLNLDFTPHWIKEACWHLAKILKFSRIGCWLPFGINIWVRRQLLWVYRIEKKGSRSTSWNLRVFRIAPISQRPITCLICRHWGSHHCNVTLCNLVFRFVLFYATFQPKISNWSKNSRKTVLLTVNHFKSIF